MKILFFSPNLTNGGTQRVMVNLANMLAMKGYEIIFVICFRNTGEYTLEENVNAIYLDAPNWVGKNYVIIKRLSIFIMCTLGLRKIIMKNKPNIIIVFLPIFVLSAMLASLFTRIPLLISVRNDPTESKIFKKIINKFLFPLADGCVFQTEEVQKFYSDRLLKKSIIINNLVNDEMFNVLKPKECLNIVGVGRLNQQKNWYIAIRAYSLIADKVKDNFYIYGTGDKYDDLQRYIESLNLVGRVILAGFHSNIENIITRAKLFVSSSDYEGSPNSLIEALILGTPCVSTRFSGGGAERLIKSGVNGILVSKGDYIALSEAMFNILTNECYAKNLAKNAKKRMVEDFNPMTVFEQWENFIKVIIKKGSK